SDRDVVDVDLVAPDEVEQQVQGPLEERELDPRDVVGQGGLHALGQVHALGLRPGQGRKRGLVVPLVTRRVFGLVAPSSFMAARTSAIVAWAVRRASCAPSRRMSRTVSGRAAYSGRRAWTSARRSSMWSVRRALQSRQPMPALRHPAAAHSWVAGGENA